MRSLTLSDPGFLAKLVKPVVLINKTLLRVDGNSVYRSTDGGHSWALYSTLPSTDWSKGQIVAASSTFIAVIPDAYYWSEEEAYAYGGSMIFSTDGGLNWTLYDDAYLNNHGYYYSTKSVAIVPYHAVGYNGNLFVSFRPFNSKDGEYSSSASEVGRFRPEWQYNNCPYGELVVYKYGSPVLVRVAGDIGCAFSKFGDLNYRIPVGRSTQASSSSIYLPWTNTWTTNGTIGDSRTIELSPSGAIWIAAYGGQLRRSTESGATDTWSSLYESGKWPYDESLRAISESIWLMYSSNGPVYRSTDGGLSWTLLTQDWGLFPPYKFVRMTNDSVIGLGDFGILWRSTDAGITWDRYDNLYGSICALP